MHAAFKGYLNVMMILVDILPKGLPVKREAGAEINIEDEAGWTPLQVAARNGHVACVAQLIKWGAHLDSTNKNGWTALMAASRNGRLECVQELVSFLLVALPSIPLSLIMCRSWLAFSLSPFLPISSLSHIVEFQLFHLFTPPPLPPQ